MHDLWQARLCSSLRLGFSLRHLFFGIYFSVVTARLGQNRSLWNLIRQNVGEVTDMSHRMVNANHKTGFHLTNCLALHSVNSPERILHGYSGAPGHPMPASGGFRIGWLQVPSTTQPSRPRV